MWRLRSTIGDCDVAHVFNPSQLIGCQFFSVILISSLDVHTAGNRDPSYQLGLSIMRRATDFISIIFHRFPEPLATAGMQRHAAVDNDLLSIAEINDCIAVVPFSPVRDMEPPPDQRSVIRPVGSPGYINNNNNNNNNGH